jgi:hypothetical protein
MKKSIMVFAAVVLMAGFTTQLMAQTENTAVGAKIVVAMTITEVNALHFGTMSVPGTIATVVVPPTGVRTFTGTITLLPGTPTYIAASYTTTGPSGGTYQITLPTSTTITSGANNMVVNTFTCSAPDPTAAVLTLTAGAFTVGATLNLASAQPAGIYAGTFDVTVTSN